MILGGYHAMRRTEIVTSIVLFLVSCGILAVVIGARLYCEPWIVLFTGGVWAVTLWNLYATFLQEPLIRLEKAPAPSQGTPFHAPAYDDELPWTHEEEFE
ncbi:hypothetical protein HYW17_04460 [Candidatus Uhrbacteria bacterium]|nr:hypothetical protein [Candidatus Uhrbacteria bacterium]